MWVVGETDLPKGAKGGEVVIIQLGYVVGYINKIQFSK